MARKRKEEWWEVGGCERAGRKALFPPQRPINPLQEDFVGSLDTSGVHLSTLVFTISHWCPFDCKGYSPAARNCRKRDPLPRGDSKQLWQQRALRSTVSQSTLQLLALPPYGITKMMRASGPESFRLESRVA